MREGDSAQERLVSHEAVHGEARALGEVHPEHDRAEEVERVVRDALVEAPHLREDEIEDPEEREWPDEHPQVAEHGVQVLHLELRRGERAGERQEPAGLGPERRPEGGPAVGQWPRGLLIGVRTADQRPALSARIVQRVVSAGDVGRPTQVGDPAVVQEHRAVAEALDRVHVVRHEQDGAPLRFQVVEVAEAFRLKRLVADLEHLVEEEDVRVDLDGHRERQGQRDHRCGGKAERGRQGRGFASIHVVSPLRV